jgi:hypothetical protein
MGRIDEETLENIIAVIKASMGDAEISLFQIRKYFKLHPDNLQDRGANPEGCRCTQARDHNWNTLFVL